LGVPLGSDGFSGRPGGRVPEGDAAHEPGMAAWVCYLQLAHTTRSPESGVSTATVIHDFRPSGWTGRR